MSRGMRRADPGGGSGRHSGGLGQVRGQEPVPGGSCDVYPRGDGCPGEGGGQAMGDSVPSRCHARRRRGGDLTVAYTTRSHGSGPRQCRGRWKAAGSGISKISKPRLPRLRQRSRWCWSSKSLRLAATVARLVPRSQAIRRSFTAARLRPALGASTTCVMTSSAGNLGRPGRRGDSAAPRGITSGPGRSPPRRSGRRRDRAAAADRDSALAIRPAVASRPRR
jgi:hypothetical protein